MQIMHKHAKKKMVPSQPEDLMRTNIISNIREFLQMEVDMLKTMRNLHRIHGYLSMSDFLLQHGRNFEPAPLPDDVKKGRAKECYCNAANIVIDEPERFIYCEGYAVGVIPVMHAFCIDVEGRVVDPTWYGKSERGRTPTLGTEYFGIAIKKDYLVKTLIKNERYGVIDQWQAEWPIMRDDPKLWKHPIMEEQHATM